MKKTKRGLAAPAAARPEARVFSGFFSLPFILLIFALVAAASLILLRGSARGLASPGFFEGAGSFILLFAAPLILIGLALALFYVLSSQLLKTGKAHPSATRNFRLVCVFALLVSALFCVFAGAFISSLFSFFRVDSIEEALDGVEDIADAYSESRFLQAEAVAGRFFTALNIRGIESSPETWLPDIRAYDPYALAVQVYAESEGAGALIPIKEEGDSSVFLDAGQIALMEDGITKDEESGQGGGRALIRLKRTARYAGECYVSLYTALFPHEVYSAAMAVERARGGFSTLKKAEPLSPFFGFWLYFSFILPPLLVLLLCALYVFVRLSDPLAALEKACEGLLQGKAGVAVIPQKYAGLDNTISFVNARSDVIDSSLELEKAAASSGSLQAAESLQDLAPGAPASGDER